MQSSPRPQETHDTFAPSNPLPTNFPDEAAVLRAYGGGIGLPSDRWRLDLQAKLVGAVVLLLAGICLLATLVLVLATWLPTWFVTLGLTLALTTLGLALFASVSRPPIFAPKGVAETRPPASTEYLSAIDELDPTEVESVRGAELALDPADLDRPRLTPHQPFVVAEAADAERDSDSDGDSDPGDLKTRPLNRPPPAPARKPLRAEMPSNVLP